MLVPIVTARKLEIIPRIVFRSDFLHEWLTLFIKAQWETCYDKLVDKRQRSEGKFTPFPSAKDESIYPIWKQ